MKKGDIVKSTVSMAIVQVIDEGHSGAFWGRVIEGGKTGITNGEVRFFISHLFKIVKCDDCKEQGDFISDIAEWVE